ncbi:MAG: alanine racemase [Gammaproteobacteria bacterium]|nr:alanine racemase [Gammaproteobacteria bacterium]
MTRPTRVLIDTEALRHNLRRVREAAPDSRTMAVIKADGYGHGLLRAARAFADADAFGVACVEEGLLLRRGGFDKPIVLLEGTFEAGELGPVAANGLELVVHCAEQIDQLATVAHAPPLDVWLKVDTGMHRLGFAPGEIAAAYERLRGLAAVGEVRLMTHLGYADDPRDGRTAEQLAAFAEAAAGLEVERSAANSGGALGWPEAHLDWVRPGLALFGASPFSDGDGAALGLKPAMTFATRLIAVKRLRRGDAVGYGGTWVCPEDMPVGVAAVGYGDGYPRHARNGTPVLVNGERVPLVGRVSMDMICLDLRAQPHANLGDDVVLWGGGLPAEEVARHADTIAYELFCGITARVPIDEV